MVDMETIGYKMEEGEEVLVLVVEWVMAVQDKEVIQQEKEPQDEHGETDVAVDVPHGFLFVYVGPPPRWLWGDRGVVMGVPPGGTPYPPFHTPHHVSPPIPLVSLSMNLSRICICC